MKSNKLLSGALWAIGLAAECGLLLCLARAYTAAVWITLGFTLFAFVSQLVLWLYLWRGAGTADGVFFRMPAFMLSALYMLLQLIPCLVFPFWQASARLAVLLNAALAVVMWVLLLLSLLAKNHIAHVDGRQKDHHREL